MESKSISVFLLLLLKAGAFADPAGLAHVKKGTEPAWLSVTATAEQNRATYVIRINRDKGIDVDKHRFDLGFQVPEHGYPAFLIPVEMHQDKTGLYTTFIVPVEMALKGSLHLGVESRETKNGQASQRISMNSYLAAGDVESAAKKALGEAFLKVEGERVFSANVSAVCEGCRFYGVQTKRQANGLQGSKNPPINALEENPFIAISKDATFLINSYESALKFLSSFKGSAASDAACLSRCLAFFELTNGDVRTRMPVKESIIEIYKKQDPKDWNLVMSGTDSGWRVSATASVNEVIDCCIRFEIDAGRDGTLRLVSRKTIYAFTLYE